MQEDLRVNRFLLIHGSAYHRRANYVAEDIAAVSPETSVELRLLDFKDPWDFEEVYGKLFDRVQLAETIRICRDSRWLSEAGCTLFATLLARRSTANDADRPKKNLSRFGMDGAGVAFR